MNVVLRAARGDDYVFAQQAYYNTMRWIIERLFGWSQEREDLGFAEQFKLEEVRIITVDRHDVGWLQTKIGDEALYVGQLYVVPKMQRCGIGSRVLAGLVAEARQQGKSVTPSVVKINPTPSFYTAKGFRVIGEDEYKDLMKLEPR